MKRGFVRFYAITALLVYIGAIFFFVYTNYNEYKNSQVISKTTFSSLQNIVDSRIKNLSDSENFLNRNFINYLSDNKNIASFAITRNNQPYFSTETSLKIKESKFVKLYSSEFTVNDDSYKLRAFLFLVNPESVLKTGEISFFVILIFTLITILLLVIATNKSKSDKKEEATAKNKNFEENNDAEASSDEVKSNLEENETESDNSSLITEENKNSGSDENPEKAKNVENAEKTIQLTDPEIDSKVKEYLTPIFAKASNENIEAAVFVMKFDFSDFTQEQTTSLIRIVSKYFGENSLLPYKANNLVSVKFLDNLKDCLKTGQILTEQLENEFKETNLKSYVGISSKAGREVSVERIMMEAESALNYSIKNDEPVIAFKVDLKQYNKLMEQKKQ